MLRVSHVCVWTLFCAVGQFWVCGILVRVFCWAIAVCEYSFLLIFGFVCSVLGQGGLGVYCFGRRVRRVAYFALCSDERNA